MDNNYIAVLLEDIKSKVDTISEGVVVANDKIDRLEQRVADIEPKTDLIPVIRTVVTEHTATIRDIDKRPVKLEEQSA